MLGAIYIGLSGMNAYSKGLQTISNNVANLNSPGFKATSVSFSDVFDQGGNGLSFTGGSGSQLGSGVRYADPQIDFSQGDLRQSEGDLDLAIQGSGFMVLTEGDRTYYARTGQFTVDEEGYVVQQGSGYKLGIVNEGGDLVPLSIADSRTSAPVATTSIKFADNLSSTGTEANVGNIAVYDATGAKQVWKVAFAAVGATAPGEWNVTVTDQTGATVGTSKIKFIAGTIDPTTAKLTITKGAGTPNALAVELDFSTNVTSYSSGTTSSIRTTSVDGNAAGEIATVTVNEEGQVELTYTNQKTETLGAVALADFTEPQQLERVGSGLFENGGGASYRLVASGEAGAGKLVSRQIEASNVDLSKEFGDLILIQRGFQASSQVVSVSNDMIQQLFGIRGQG
jgi:flagellar hook protein FlgE